MVKKRKGRSVRKNKQIQEEPEELIQAPHSFVVHRGLSGNHIVELTKDFRKVMEPFTASHLKERKKNTIKDFVSISGALHVSHLCIFTHTELGMYLKIGKLPRGPTLTFKIHSFSLARDVISTLKKQYVFSEIFMHSPLIVLNSFSGEGHHMKLMATTFQNMFPAINLQNVNLNNIRRNVLLNYNPSTKLIDFRHYAIKVLPVGLSKGVKKVVQGKVPNLSRCNDISELLTKSGILSDSEVEDDPNSHVTVPQKLTSRGNMESGQSAIKMSELGPRLTLQLMKIEAGLLDGEVLFHELIEKTDEEKAVIKKRIEEKKKLKEKRKHQQEANTKQKEEKKEELKKKSLEGMKKKGQTENDRLMKKAVHEANEDADVEDDDIDYYRKEIGEEPDKDLFSASRKRSMSFTPQRFKNKKVKLDNNPSKRTHFKNNDKRNDVKDKRNKDMFNKNNNKFKKHNTHRNNSHNKNKVVTGSKIKNKGMRRH